MDVTSIPQHIPETRKEQIRNKRVVYAGLVNKHKVLDESQSITRDTYNDLVRDYRKVVKKLGKKLLDAFVIIAEQEYEIEMLKRANDMQRDQRGVDGAELEMYRNRVAMAEQRLKEKGTRKALPVQTQREYYERYMQEVEKLKDLARDRKRGKVTMFAADVNSQQQVVDEWRRKLKSKWGQEVPKSDTYLPKTEEHRNIRRAKKDMEYYADSYDILDAIDRDARKRLRTKGLIK